MYEEPRGVIQKVGPEMFYRIVYTSILIMDQNVIEKLNPGNYIIWTEDVKVLL